MFFPTAAFALLLAQVTPAPSPPATASPDPACAAVATLVGTESTTALTATPGQTVAVLLGSNPSTGYAWSLAEPPDPAVAVRLGSARAGALLPAGSQRAGAPGQELWLFTARAAGSTSFVLAYARPWERAAPARTVRFTLEVSVPSTPCPGRRRFRPSAG